VVAGGAGGGFGPTSVTVGQGGIAAVQCRVQQSAGAQMFRPGVPVIADVDSGGVPVVREFLRGNSQTTLVGLTAAPASFLGSVRVVPVATAGLVQVTLATGVASVSVGTPLRPDSSGSDTLRLVPSTDGSNIVARAAQSTPADGSVTQIVAWVVHPPQNLGDSGF
jgi:hypothetical protein